MGFFSKKTPEQAKKDKEARFKKEAALKAQREEKERAAAAAAAKAALEAAAAAAAADAGGGGGDSDDDFEPASKKRRLKSAGAGGAVEESEDEESEDEETKMLRLLEADDDDEGGGGADNDDAEEEDDEEAFALALLAEQDVEEEKTVSAKRAVDDDDADAAAAKRRKAETIEAAAREPDKAAAKQAAAAALSNEPSPKKKKPAKPAASAWGSAAVDQLTTKPPTPKKAEPPAAETKKPMTSFRDFKSRDNNPAALGTKEIPVGEGMCLYGLKMVITGVMESTPRAELEDLVKRYGAELMKSISSKTDFAVVGKDAGPKKIQMIAKHKTKQLDEDGLFELIKTRTMPKEAAEAAFGAEDPDAPKKKKKGGRTPAGGWTKGGGSKASNQSAAQTAEAAAAASTSKGQVQNGTPGNTDDPNGSLWTVKYAPTAAAKIAGQHGPRSNMNKLKVWLKAWYENKAKRKAGPKPRKASDTGWEFGCCLMAGPPGVGKTTTAHLVCQELGFEVIEMNASDCRSKKTLKEHVASDKKIKRPSLGGLRRPVFNGLLKKYRHSLFPSRPSMLLTCAE